MTDTDPNRPALPDGWLYPDREWSERLVDELQRELPAGHLLVGVPVEVFAAREATDDVLFRHLGGAERFTVVHLTWAGKTEINAHHPPVEFDGTFSDFLRQEERLYGLTTPPS